jgi:hypothetical protein
MRLLSKTSLFVGACAVTMLSACSASKSGGPSEGPVSPSVAQTAKLRASDALSGVAVAGAAVSGNGLTGGTTDSTGAVTLSTSTAATYGVDVTASGYVTRNTLLKLPGNDAAVSLIANSFDLAAFNQMFRVSALQRWTSAPTLVIISNVLEYNDAGPTQTALAEALTPEEIQSIISDLSYGLPLLTAGHFANFSSISTQTVSAGEAVTLLTTGRITFARCHGVTAARQASGVGQWQFQSDDTVTGGSVCVDRDFELSNNALRRGIRLHEMGHALGSQHVTVKDGVLMNPTITVNDVTTWDRDAAKIAFQRPPGNRSPDRDPATFSTNRLGTRVMTSDGCRVGRR